jgi:hypothetical protein
MSIEAIVGDRGFWLQTGRVARVSAVERLNRGKQQQRSKIQIMIAGDFNRHDTT